MAERTLPTAGMSPIDGYMSQIFASGVVGLPAAYFESVPRGVSGASLSCVYVKVNEGTERHVTGRVSGVEIRLDLGVSSTTPPTQSLLCLDYSSANTDSISNSRSSYIMLRERSTAGIGQQMNTLFDFYDAPITTNITTDLLTTCAASPSTHSIRCMADGAPLWILCSNTHTT